MTAAGGRIELSGLAKAYDGVPAVTGIDLDIAGGEFFPLLGACGCGKTTTLRMIAGGNPPPGCQRTSIVNRVTDDEPNSGV